jgi:hypothetical protein
MMKLAPQTPHEQACEPALGQRCCHNGTRVVGTATHLRSLPRLLSHDGQPEHFSRDPLTAVTAFLAPLCAAAPFVQ